VKADLDSLLFAILSVTWTKQETIDFLKGLSKGSIFGYSSSFFGYSSSLTLDDVQSIVASCGMEVSPLPTKNPLYKKYGEYVLKVTTPYTPPKEVATASFNNTYHYRLMHSPGKRKCAGRDCPVYIERGEQCLEVADLVELPNTRKAYKKTTYCPKCSRSLLKNTIGTLLSVMPGDAKKNVSSKKAVMDVIAKVFP